MQPFFPGFCAYHDTVIGFQTLSAAVWTAGLVNNNKCQCDSPANKENQICRENQTHKCVCIYICVCERKTLRLPHCSGTRFSIKWWAVCCGWKNHFSGQWRMSQVLAGPFCKRLHITCIHSCYNHRNIPYHFSIKYNTQYSLTSGGFFAPGFDSWEQKERMLAVWFSMGPGAFWPAAVLSVLLSRSQCKATTPQLQGCAGTSIFGSLKPAKCPPPGAWCGCTPPGKPPHHNGDMLGPLKLADWVSKPPPSGT